MKMINLFKKDQPLGYIGSIKAADNDNDKEQQLQNKKRINKDRRKLY